MNEKPAARALDVVADLIRQLQRGTKLLFAPEQGVKVEPHRVVVDVRVEVEDVALDRRRIIFVKSRTDADVRDALERAGKAFEARRRHVDARAGEQLVCRIDIDGG